MLNLKNLLYDITNWDKEKRTYLSLTDNAVSLSARYNYLARLSNKLMSFFDDTTNTNMMTAEFFSPVSTYTFTTLGGTGTMYLWTERANWNASLTNFVQKGLYLMYFGPPTTMSEMSQTSTGIHYCHFDIPISPTYFSSFKTSGVEDGIFYTSMSNSRVLGAHGRLVMETSSACIRIYVYLTTSTEITSTTEINLFGYIPITAENTLIR